MRSIERRLLLLCQVPVGCGRRCCCIAYSEMLACWNSSEIVSLRLLRASCTTTIRPSTSCKFFHGARTLPPPSSVTNPVSRRFPVTPVKASTPNYRTNFVGKQQIRLFHVTKAMTQRAYIALGSNLGDRIACIEEACRKMEEGGHIKVLRTSSLWETRAMYVLDQNKFVNGVCEVGLQRFAASHVQECSCTHRLIRNYRP